VKLLAEDMQQNPDGPEPEAAEEKEVLSHADRLRLESDFALTLVDTLFDFNSEKISSYAISSRFFTTDEITCFWLFINSVPVNPLPAIYPESPFLLFRGVPLPKSVNLAETAIEEVLQAFKSGSEADFQGLQLSDLTPDLVNSFQIATQIYNSRVDKTRTSYLANVKAAKSQVVEVSAAVICGLVLVMLLISIT
tara:strand:+ start:84 stop:665 length:582 start_codon:yes stop_codon:yes gene_type:complete